MVEVANHRPVTALRIENLAETRLMQIAFYDRGQSEADGGLPMPAERGCFRFSPAPGRIMLYGPLTSDWSAIVDALPLALGCITELGHSRSAYLLSGSGVERYLSSLFAVDFSIPAFPVGKGVATVHHEAPVYLIRSAADAFHCLVARSFDRDFETVLKHVAQGWNDVPAQ